MRVEAEGKELVLQNSNGDTVIFPRKQRRKVMVALRNKDYKTLDEMASKLPSKASYAQDGTVQPVDTVGYYNKSADLLKKYANLNWVNRALNAKDKSTLRIPSEGGRTASHKLGYSEFDEGLYAYPNVVQDGDSLREFTDWREAVDYNRSKRELVPLGKDKDFAEYFTRVGYKQNFPESDYKEALEEYSRDTNIKKYDKGGIVDGGKTNLLKEVTVYNKKDYSDKLAEYHKKKILYDKEYKAYSDSLALHGFTNRMLEERTSNKKYSRQKYLPELTEDTDGYIKYKKKLENLKEYNKEPVVTEEFKPVDYGEASNYKDTLRKLDNADLSNYVKVKYKKDPRLGFDP